MNGLLTLPPVQGRGVIPLACGLVTLLRSPPDIYESGVTCQEWGLECS